MRFVMVYEVHPKSRIDTTAAWEKSCLIYQIDQTSDNLSIVVYAFLGAYVKKIQDNSFSNITIVIKAIEMMMKEILVKN